jgi:hypothetical protein
MLWLFYIFVPATCLWAITYWLALRAVDPGNVRNTFGTAVVIAVLFVAAASSGLGLFGVPVAIACLGTFLHYYYELDVLRTVLVVAAAALFRFAIVWCLGRLDDVVPGLAHVLLVAGPVAAASLWFWSRRTSGDELRDLPAAHLVRRNKSAKGSRPPTGAASATAMETSRRPESARPLAPPPARTVSPSEPTASSETPPGEPRILYRRPDRVGDEL